MRRTFNDYRKASIDELSRVGLKRVRSGRHLTEYTEGDDIV